MYRNHCSPVGYLCSALVQSETWWNQHLVLSCTKGDQKCLPACGQGLPKWWVCTYTLHFQLITYSCDTYTEVCVCSWSVKGNPVKPPTRSPILSFHELSPCAHPSTPSVSHNWHACIVLGACLLVQPDHTQHLLKHRPTHAFTCYIVLPIHRSATRWRNKPKWRPTSDAECHEHECPLWTRVGHSQTHSPLLPP